jgi:hypothetical protein
MSGRPSIVAWVPTGQNLRIEFFSVDVSSGSLMQRGLQNSTWTNWAKIAAGVSDRVVSCRMGGDLLSRADVWFATTKDKIAGHSSSAQVSPKNSSKDAIGYVPDNILTQGAYPAATAPGITCRQADIEHNLVLYHLDTRTASVRQWNVPSNAWSTAVSVGDVRFIDEPVVVDVSKDRFDFLGIGEDDALYHFSWVGGTLGKLEQIGKGFASAPSGVSFGSSDRLDVVAVGIDGRLRHRSLLGEKWSADWDDLGIDAAGAPLLAQSDGNIHLFVSGEKDEVRHAVINGTNVATKWDIRDSIRTLD